MPVRSAEGPLTSPSKFTMSFYFSQLNSFSRSQTTNYPGRQTAVQMICAYDETHIFVQKLNYNGVVGCMQIEKQYAEAILAEKEAIKSQILRTTELLQAVKQRNLSFDEAMSVISSENEMLLFLDDLILGFQGQLYDMGENGIRMSCTWRHYRERLINGQTRRYFSNEGINLSPAETQIFMDFLESNFSNSRLSDNNEVEE